MLKILIFEITWHLQSLILQIVQQQHSQYPSDGITIETTEPTEDHVSQVTTNKIVISSEGNIYTTMEIAALSLIGTIVGVGDGLLVVVFAVVLAGGIFCHRRMTRIKRDGNDESTMMKTMNDASTVQDVYIGLNKCDIMSEEYTSLKHTQHQISSSSNAQGNSTTPD